MAGHDTKRVQVTLPKATYDLLESMTEAGGGGPIPNVAGYLRWLAALEAKKQAE